MFFLNVLPISTKDFSHCFVHYEQSHNLCVAEWGRKWDGIESEQSAHGSFPCLDTLFVQSHRTRDSWLLSSVSRRQVPSCVHCVSFNKVHTHLLKDLGLLLLLFLLLLGCCEEYFVLFLVFVMRGTSLRPGTVRLHSSVIPAFWIEAGSD